jgi:hypothetical protein
MATTSAIADILECGLPPPFVESGHGSTDAAVVTTDVDSAVRSFAVAAFTFVKTAISADTAHITNDAVVAVIAVIAVPDISAALAEALLAARIPNLCPYRSDNLSSISSHQVIGKWDSLGVAWTICPRL